jgi:hypothetical protein|uniref:Uncharacterized protein n=1 Tax=Myoviridae sp. ctpKu3 TaxID=2825175 RepID=A0A8S5UVT8_9CAUD|nr:MAG TPA: hypothetical protein [Myoviridae sp. ctpKu3]
MANFGSKNETFAYLVGKDIAEIKAKIEGIGTTSGGLDVFKIVIPSVTEDEVINGATAVVNLPDEFKNSLVLLEKYGSYSTSILSDTIEFNANAVEQEYFIIKLTDFKNPKLTVRATIKEASSASDA